jgi:hypothetical protein
VTLLIVASRLCALGCSGKIYKSANRVFSPKRARWRTFTFYGLAPASQASMVGLTWLSTISRLASI